MYTENSKVVPVDIQKEMQKSYLAYSMSVIVGRALPDVRDGLKPVHRRILYTLHENGITAGKPYRKCADTVGSVLGRYHPHGDASVYDALVRMAQDFSLRYPLIDGHGNFGSIDGDPPAAYRYTEARMARLSSYMLSDIEKDTVDFGTNYDDRLQEPSVLPARFPNLLVNGSTGIAVGMATNIPPHNLREVIDGLCVLIDDPQAGDDALLQTIKGPDFPTGGIIMGRSGIRAAYMTGRGRLTVRARTEIEAKKNGRFHIIVSEIPYMVNKARLIESIADHVKDKRIEGISDLRDESDRDGMRIVIELKREANAQIVLNQLFKFTQMQDTFGATLLAIDEGVPKVMTLRDMLTAYLKHQAQVVRRRTEFELKKARERAHILEGLYRALDIIDEIIAVLRASKSIPDGKQALIDRWQFTDVQADAIVQMRLGQLTGLEREKIENELAELKKRIAELETILSDEMHVLAIVRQELCDVRDKYGDDRRTEIAAVTGEVDIEDLIPEEDCVITLTQAGYLKRMAADVYKTQKRGGRGVSGMTQKDEDFAVELFVASTHDYVLFFSNFGRVYRLKCYEIPEMSRASRGLNVVNLLPLSPDEHITSMIKVPEFLEGHYLVMVTKNGLVKRTELSAYNTARKAGVIAIGLHEGDELAWVRLTSGSDELLVATKRGMAIRFKESDARPLSRTAHGVKAMTLKGDDCVVGMARVRDGAMLLTVTEYGQGRRSEFSEYRLQTRGGKGVLNYHVNAERGDVAAVRTVDEDDDVIIISSDGIIIRIAVSDISVQSRYASGVRVMRVPEDAKIVTVARATKEPDEGDEDDEDGTPEGVVPPEDVADIGDSEE